MNLLLLPGNSKRHKEWLRQVEASLSPQFDKTYCHDYAHWETNEPEIDLDHEIKSLAESIQELNPYIIFAKSAGTVLAIKASAINVLKPKACLFVGLPLVMIRDHNLETNQWLKENEFPITILQHSDDPYGSYYEVKRYIESINRKNLSVHELEGDSHDYLEFSSFKDYTANFINS